MNCLKVQEAIWCGELDAAMLQHIATCPDCKSEQRKVQELSFSLESMDIPMQSRSLLPTRHEIEQSLRVQSRRRFTKWGIRSVAAVACVALAVLVVPKFFTTDQPLKTATQGNHPVVTTDPNQKDNNTTSNDPTQLSDQKGVAQKPPIDQSLVTVDPNADTKHFPQEIDSLRAYLTKVSDPNMFKHITIKNFVQDTVNSDANNISGTVTLTIQHQPGQGSAYGTGDAPFDVTRFAHFTKQQGLWTFDGALASSPFFLHSGDPNAGGWHTVDTKYFSLQLPVFLVGEVQPDGSLIITNQGKPMGSVAVEQQKTHAPGDYYNAVTLPNQVEVESKGTIDMGNPNLHAVQFMLNFTPPTSDPENQPTYGTRTYFMSDDKLVFDLAMPNTLELATFNKIIHSFKTK